MNDRRRTVSQFVVLIRGGAATGKTTIAKSIRDELDNTIVISIDEIIKMIGDFSYVNKKLGYAGALHLADYYAAKGWNIVFDELFENERVLDTFRDWAASRALPCFVFHLFANIQDVMARNRNHGRDSLTDERLTFLSELTNRTLSSPNIVPIDTSRHSVQECTARIVETICRGAVDAG